MNIDIKKIARSSILFLGVGIILVIVSVILQLLTLLVEGEAGEMVALIATIYSYILYPDFFGLFLLAGYRAVKIHGLDPIGAGSVAALSYVVVAIVQLLLNALLAILVLSGLIPSGAGFASIETVMAAALFGDAVGIIGLGRDAVCGFGLILVGALFNFVIGGSAGLYASK